MRLLLFVLNKTEKLEELLNALMDTGIGGATVWASTGMAKVLHGRDEEDIPFLGSLRSLLNPKREQSETIFMVIQDCQLTPAVDAFERVVGSFENQDTGIAFSFPLDFVKGLPNCDE